VTRLDDSGPGSLREAIEAEGARIVVFRVSGKVTFGKGVVRDPAEVGDWALLRSRAAPVDVDGDGMPDTWEKKNGLDGDDASDGSEDRDGYTNVEEYINGLVPKRPVREEARP